MKPNRPPPKKKETTKKLVGKHRLNEADRFHLPGQGQGVGSGQISIGRGNCQN